MCGQSDAPAEPLLSDAAPSAAEQQRMLAEMRQYARQYVSNLPNFICVQVTRQFEAGKKGKHWRKGDSLTARLTYNQGREDRVLYLVNDKPVQPGSKRWRTPLVTEGEFGMLLSRVLAEDGTAAFTWSRWETIRGKRLAVFDYVVDKEHSVLSLSLGGYVKAVVPYTGSVYCDPATGAVWRITDTVSDIPPELQTKTIGTTIDYAEAAIGNSSYLLPLQATVSMTTDKNQIRNEMEFQNYRKFEAESSITFGREQGAGGPANPKDFQPAASSNQLPMVFPNP
jgi:hypothetical protein